MDRREFRRRLAGRPNGVRFEELERLLNLYGWTSDRSRGSHFGFRRGAEKLVSPSRRPHVITGEPVEGYLGDVPELPGCVTAGETAEEALGNLDEAMAVWIESTLGHGDPIPEPAAGPVRLSV